MAGLKKQLEQLQPLLDEKRSLHETQLTLLGIEPEEYYKENQGNLLHQLGLLTNQIRVFSFNHHFSLDNFFEKLTLLVKKETDKEIIFEEKDGWILKIDGKEFQLGKLGTFFDWIVDPLKILEVPQFFKAITEALEPYMPSGNFYYGYLKDEHSRKYLSFKFLLVFVKHENNPVLAHLNELFWVKLQNKSISGKAIESGKLSTIDYEISSEKSEFKWKAKTSTLSAILFILSIILLIALGEKLIQFSDRELPNWIFIYAPLVIIPLLILDYINRLCVLTIAMGKIIFVRGSMPFFPGYRQRSFYLNEIIKVRTKLKTNTLGDDNYSTAESNDHSIYITTNKPKDVCLIKHLSTTESLFLESKIKAACGQLK